MEPKLKDIMTRLIELGVAADTATQDHEDFVTYAYRSGQLHGQMLRRLIDLEERLLVLEGYSMKKEDTASE